MVINTNNVIRYYITIRYNKKFRLPPRFARGSGSTLHRDGTAFFSLWESTWVYGCLLLVTGFMGLWIFMGVVNVYRFLGVNRRIWVLIWVTMCIRVFIGVYTPSLIPWMGISKLRRGGTTSFSQRESMRLYRYLLLFIGVWLWVIGIYRCVCACNVYL